MRQFINKLILLTFFALFLGVNFSPNALAYGGLINNGDFESGHTQWYEALLINGSLTPVNNIIQSGNNGGSGNYYAYMYSSSIGQDMLFSNDFVLPSDYDSLLLNFDSKYRLGYDSSCISGFNVTAVGLSDVTTSEVITTATLNNANNTFSSQDSYSNRSVLLGSGLTARAGHTIRLTVFSITDDPNCEQVLYLDNVSLQNGKLTPVYRFYNFIQGVHFYTANQAEATNVKNNMATTYRYEGISYFANTNQESGTTPVYRFYNFIQGVHFYTANQAEATNVNNNMPATYRYEGVSYFAFP